MSTRMPTRFQAIRGVRVLSLCLNLPGPAALMRLRSMGARCVKIEPPGKGTAGADPMELYAPGLYRAMHERVQVLRVDLKSQSGQIKLHRELDQADVLLTSFRPSALKRLGLTWGKLHAAYPRLCMVSIVGGLGEAAEHPGHDLTYLAQSGLVNDLRLPPTLFADMAGSVLASEAVLQVVLHREVTGSAQRLSVALSDAAQLLALPKHWGLTGDGTTLGGQHAGYRVYPCADGRVAVAALEGHFSRALCEETGLTWTGAAQMLAPQTHHHFEAYFHDKSCEKIRRWASDRDIPLWAMPNAN